MSFPVAPEWVHVQYQESAQFTEVYGFAGTQGAVNCEGVRFTPRGKPSKTLAVFMHPSSTLQLLPMPQALARAGIHVLCAGSRFARNDTPLIMEKVLLDLGAYIRHAKEAWGYEKILLCGWSGGNGFSRAWRDDIFSYDALLEQARFENLSPFARLAFDALGTTDFEEVMRALRSAAALIRLYDEADDALPPRLIEDATGLRETLVRAIAGRHPERPHEVSEEEYAHARRFLANFRSIYSVNYDLLPYWALMQQEVEPQIQFDDGFRQPDDGPADYVTWEVEKTDGQNVFYLHGALHIFDAGHEIQKYTWINTGVPLIDQIRSALGQNLYPLFVSEGESRQKLSKIKHSEFLGRGYRSFAKIGGGLFIYGHSFAPNDEHILRLVEKNKCSQVLVGLYGDPDSPANRRIRDRTQAMVVARPARRRLEAHFYDAASTHVWRD